MITIDSKFINNAIIKWSTIINTLNIDERFEEPISIFSELCSFNHNNLNISNSIYNDSILPMSIKAISKLKLENIKLVIDTKNYYVFNTYRVKIKFTINQEDDFKMISGTDVITMLSSSFVEQISTNINDKIEKEKLNILIIDSNFISNIARFPEYVLLSYRYILTSIKKERCDKINKINKINKSYDL